jgi:hypothetical protein
MSNINNFQDLLEQHVGTSLLRQHALSDFLGEHQWNATMSQGTIDFGKKRVYPMQVLGSESEISGTWLWGWANTGSPLTDAILQDGKMLQKLGERDNIAEFTEAEFPISDTVHGHVLALTARGICGADAYYRGPYEGGAIFIMLRDVPLESFIDRSPMKIINVLQSVISQITINHKKMAHAFLTQQGYILTEEGNNTIATDASDNKITLQFDAQNRIVNMASTLSSANVMQKTKKPWWKLGS